MQRYPENIDVTLDNFKECGWHKAIQEARREDYSSMWQSLSDAARQAIEEDRLAEGKVLWLLADACSMMLRPASLNEPFSPNIVMDGKRSTLPEDFEESDVRFFAEITSEIDDPKLCARIADIVWLLGRPKEVEYALMAIDNYCQIPIDSESWVKDGRECWDRAVQLCFMLRATAGNRLIDIETAMVESMKSSSMDDGFLPLWVSDLLAKHKLGIVEQVVISEKLEELAMRFDENGIIHRSKDYFDAAADWYKKCGNQEKSAEMVVRNAEGWVKEAESRLQSDTPSHMVAASFYESAIQKLRTIPRALRAPLGIDDRITNLSKDMSSSGELSLNEMGAHSSDPIDISELIENAIKAVQGKTTLDALLSLANVYSGAKAESLRKLSEEMIRKYPLQSMISATHMSVDGRVVAKRAGADPSGDLSEDAIRAEMIKYYVMEIGIVVQGDIWPALDIVRKEHRLKEEDFYSIVRQSPVVPPDRQWLMAKALYSGYDNDFTVALHLLVPQIEHVVRYHLKQHDVKTTNLDLNGIENENGLSALMENIEVNDIFGKDMAFEIKALFCDPFGPNLRNELAHGLISYDESQSRHSIYAWWLGLRLVLNTFWNARQKEKLKHMANNGEKPNEAEK